MKIRSVAARTHRRHRCKIDFIFMDVFLRHLKTVMKNNNIAFVLPCFKNDIEDFFGGLAVTRVADIEGVEEFADAFVAKPQPSRH